MGFPVSAYKNVWQHFRLNDLRRLVGNTAHLAVVGSSAMSLLRITRPAGESDSGLSE